MSNCPECGSETDNLNHRLAKILWAFKGDRPEIGEEVWICLKHGKKYYGKLCENASEEVKKDYIVRKKLFWNMVLEEVCGGEDDIKILFSIAGCYEELESYKLALSYLDQVLEKDPRNIDCIYHKGIIYNKDGKPDLARLEFMRAARKGHKESQNYLHEHNL